MPLASKSQERFLWAKHPKLAQEFEDKTPENAKLPEHVKKMSEGGVADAADLDPDQTNQLYKFLQPQGAGTLAPSAAPENDTTPKQPQPPMATTGESAALGGNRDAEDKIADSHPGLKASNIPPDTYNKYIQGQEQAVDTFGPAQQAALMQHLQQGYKSPGNILAKGGATLADAIMQGVARAGSSGNLAAINEREQQEKTRALEAGKSLQQQQLEALGKKQGLEAMNAATPLGATEGKAAQFLAKRLWPEATPAQLAAIGQNPQSLKALLPLGVDLQKALAEIANTAEFRQESLANQRLGLIQTGEHERAETIGGAARALESRGLLQKVGEAFHPTAETKALESQIAGAGGTAGTTTGPLGPTTVRNGKTYVWVPSTGKYHKQP